MNIAIFASGKGSNAANICRYFKNHSKHSVALIVTDRKTAGVLDVAKTYGLESLYINKEGWKNILSLSEELKRRNIGFIVLAGFLKLVPEKLVHAFRGRIINIHPALLPKFGGAGMYGHHVHEAVHQSGETETGITVHFVDEHFDRGDIIFQAKTPLNKNDSPELIAARIHSLEMQHFPKVIEEVIEQLSSAD